MNTVNHVTLLGNLVRSPRLATTKNGDTVCNATIATNEKPKTQYTDIVLWGKSAEYFHQLVDKGSRVYVEGVINTYTYDEDKQKTEIVVTKFIALDNDKMNQEVIVDEKSN